MAVVIPLSLFNPQVAQNLKLRPSGIACSVGVQIVDNVERIVNDEPFDGVLEVGRQHSLAVVDLLQLGVVIVFNLELVHVEVRNSCLVVKMFQEFLLTQEIKGPLSSSSLHFQRKVFQILTS